MRIRKNTRLKLILGKSAHCIQHQNKLYSENTKNHQFYIRLPEALCKINRLTIIKFKATIHLLSVTFIFAIF